MNWNEIINYIKNIIEEEKLEYKIYVLNVDVSVDYEKIKEEKCIVFFVHETDEVIVEKKGLAILVHKNYRLSKDDILEKIFDEKKLRELKDKEFKRAVQIYLEKQISEKEKQIDAIIKMNIIEKNICFEDYLKIVQNIKKLQVEQKDLRIEKKTAEKLQSEIELIGKHQLVVDIEFEEGYICVNTKTIIATEPITERKYLIGRMKIKMPLSSEKKLLILNLDRTVDTPCFSAAQHPHIDAFGTPCMGTADAQFLQFLGEEEHYAAFCTLIDYLQHGIDVNDYAGWYVSMWDEVNEKGEIIKKGHRPYANEYNDEGYGVTEGSCCEICDDYISSDDEVICEVCGRVICEDCCEWVESEDKYVCKRCLAEGYYKCKICDNYFKEEKMYKHEGLHYCEICYEELDENE